jgi:predicted ATP-dependent serine protease
MINAAETRGTCVYAIQHLTKGGQYVGGTFLKHKTTAMMHFMFDSAGGRYVTYSKNRRCGSKQNMPLYFSLDKATGEVVYDGEKFNELINTTSKVHDEQERLGEMKDNFDKLMNSAAEKRAAMDSAFAKHENDADDSLGISLDDRPIAQRTSDVEFMDDIAETVEFEDIIN